MNKSEKQLRKIIRETISNILNSKLEINEAHKYSGQGMWSDFKKYKIQRPPRKFAEKAKVGAMIHWTGPMSGAKGETWKKHKSNEWICIFGEGVKGKKLSSKDLDKELEGTGRVQIEEAKDPFVPTYGKGNVVHDCPKHVQEMKSGKKGKVVNHSLNESGEVNYVDVDFGTGKIFENIPTKKLKVLESHVHEHQVKEEPTKKLSEGNSYYDLKQQYYELSDNIEFGGIVSTLQDIKKKRDTDAFEKIEMKDMEQCEEQGKYWRSKKPNRFEFLDYVCIKGK